MTDLLDKTIFNLRSGCRETKKAFLWINISSEPLSALYSLLPFILVKDFGCSAIEISIFCAIRPLVPFLAFYWNNLQIKVIQQQGKNLITMLLLAYIPFVFCFLIKSFWYFLFAAASYQLFTKALAPSIIEVLKQNVPKETRETLFSFSYILCFLISCCLGKVIGFFLDEHNGSWINLCSLFASIALFSLVFIRKIKSKDLQTEQITSSPKQSFSDALKESLRLIQDNQDFKRFQIGFMIGGSALMLMVPAINIFFAGTLKLSHSDITNARFIYMAVGIVSSSYFWRFLLKKTSINFLMPWITLGFGVYPLLALASFINLDFLNIAFFVYGVAQAGSHLIWNLSGTVFSKDKTSVPYTSINILSQGLRGMIAPFLGGALCTILGAIPVIVLGSIICFYGVLFMKDKSLLTNETKNLI